MFTFTCPSCIKPLFSVTSISPCTAPQQLPDLIYGECRLVKKTDHVKLIKHIKCRCGKDIGVWILSSSLDDYGTWLMSGIWSSPGLIAQCRPSDSLLKMTKNNIELRKSLIERTERIKVLVEGIAVQFIEFAKRIISKISGVECQLTSAGVGSLRLIIEIHVKLSDLLDVVKAKIQDKIVASKKTVKIN